MDLFSNERIAGCILNSAIARAKVPQTKSSELCRTRWCRWTLQAGFPQLPVFRVIHRWCQRPRETSELLWLLDDVSWLTLPCKSISKFTFRRRYQKLSCKNLAVTSDKKLHIKRNVQRFLQEADLWPKLNLTIHVKLILFYSLLINFALFVVHSCRIVRHYKNDKNRGVLAKLLVWTAVCLCLPLARGCSPTARTLTFSPVSHNVPQLCYLHCSFSKSLVNLLK